MPAVGRRLGSLAAGSADCSPADRAGRSVCVAMEPANPVLAGLSCAVLLLALLSTAAAFGLFQSRRQLTVALLNEKQQTQLAENQARLAAEKTRYAQKQEGLAKQSEEAAKKQEAIARDALEKLKGEVAAQRPLKKQENTRLRKGSS